MPARSSIADASIAALAAATAAGAPSAVPIPPSAELASPGLTPVTGRPARRMASWNSGHLMLPMLAAEEWRSDETMGVWVPYDVLPAFAAEAPVDSLPQDLLVLRYALLRAGWQPSVNAESQAGHLSGPTTRRTRFHIVRGYLDEADCVYRRFRGAPWSPPPRIVRPLP